MKKILSALLLLLLLAAAALFFLPGAMERSAALWLRHHANRSGVTISFDRIRAPLLRPLEIQNLKISRAARDGTANLEIVAPALELKFHLASALGLTKNGHALRLLRAPHLVVTLQGRAASPAAFDWNALSWLLPDEFDLQADRILLDQPLLHARFENAQISGNSAHSGMLAVGTIDFRAPLSHQTFADVHGLTRWQNDRLIIAGTRLRDGLTFDSITLDFTRLADERLAADFAATIFGGALRMNLATEKGENARIWEGAASLSDISLAQLSGALGATEPITGVIHASKLTFHGDPRDFVHATASIWMELTGFSWRERNADVVMLGANFYNRTVQLQELFLKQRANELTLSGETTIGADWLKPDFHGEISGAINDLGQFAELFGQSANDFRGKISVRGHVHTYERKIDGEVALTGDALTLFRIPVALLTARAVIDSSEVELAQFDLKRGEDFLHATGKMNFGRNGVYSLSVSTACREVADYNVSLPLLGKLTGPFDGTLTSSGTPVDRKFELHFNNEPLQVSAAADWRNETVTFAQLDLTNSEIATSFTGEINLTDRHHVTAAFTSPRELHFEIPSENCVRGVRFAASETAQTFTKIEFDGRDLKFDGEVRAHLCPATEAGMPLTLFAAP